MSEPLVVLGCVTITYDSYRANKRHREIANRVMEEYGHDPCDVTEIRVSEVRVEVDWLHRHQAGIDTHTAVYEPRASHV
jgi:hypothetical protein